MPGESGRDHDPESLAQARRVNLACERFELAWRVGEEPRIEDVLSVTALGDRDFLLRELLALEIELRRGQGENPSISEYKKRFPDLVALVESTFLDPELGGTPVDSTDGSSPSTLEDIDYGETFDFGGRSASGSNGPRCLSEGEKIGDYLLIKEIARGGMGVVYEAEQISLGRKVALKMILTGAMATLTERERFRREARLAAKLNHRNIVPIMSVHDQDGILFFTMKLIDGGSLAQRASRFKDDPRSIARLIKTLAGAVHHAHGQGFIHCDLKPSNILIDQDDEPHITDFGLARLASEDSSLTATGAILGTPSYMAPEQASGQRKSIGPATDVYGLGAILYELLTGRPPFRTSSMMETVVQVLERDPVSPREIRPEVPRELEIICLKCLEKMPHERYPSAQALADDLERYLQGDVVEATGVVQNLKRWTRREPEAVSRLGGLAVVALLTEANHRFFRPVRDSGIHYGVQGILLLWAISAIVFQQLWRKGWRSDKVRMLWSTADLICLTMVLKLLGRVDSSLLVGYPLMIAASGLWFRVCLVWFTTGLSIACYLLLYVDSVLHRVQLPSELPTSANWQYPNIFVASLALTGFVVARQVKRILALSQYYEHRQQA
jgi:eukaryotic-like serine/threonine-protein kinase